MPHVGIVTGLVLGCCGRALACDRFELICLTRFAASLTPPTSYIFPSFSYAALGCRMLLSVRVWNPVVSGILCSRSFVRKKWVMDIFTFIRGLFSNDLYIQVWEKRLKVSNIQTREVYEIEPLMAIEIQPKGHRVVFKIGASCKSLDAKKYQIINPFSHPRSLMVDFEVAEKLLQHAIRELHKSNFLTPSPRVIIQPMEKIDGGLTFIERKAFGELCLGAGAIEVIVYTGDEMALHNIDFAKVKQSESSEK